jgi:hypothetical protein
MKDIRKVSVGPDYKNAMHYSVGQHVVSGTHTIHHIKCAEAYGYEIYIENDKREVFLWKKISESYPVILEFNIDFE